MNSRYFIIVFFILILNSVSTAATPTVEYRLKSKKEGSEFKWSSGKTEHLEAPAFMLGTDFKLAVARNPKNPNSPENYEVELIHSEAGRKKFRAVANLDRERSYCIVFESLVRQCYAFSPRVKGLDEKGSSIYGPFSKAEAEKLVSKINASLH